MERVKVTRPFFGICHMQVCAVTDATDEEILATCNQKNPSGTMAGWCSVIREDPPDLDPANGEKSIAPVVCEEYPGRRHFLVGC